LFVACNTVELQDLDIDVEYDLAEPEPIEESEPILHEEPLAVVYDIVEEILPYNYFYYEEIALPAFMVAIDPGHQGRGNYETEPNGPGSSTYKAKVATGTRGVVTGVLEYRLNLEVSLKLRDELKARGFDVYMVRETNDVNISNRERAIAASEAGADIFIRIHANGSGNRDVNGIMMLNSTANNPYIPHLYEESRALSEALLYEMLASTGARDLGIVEVDNMTGNNWSSVPVTIVEMGFMTNPREDELMQTYEYQLKLVDGIANGIEKFFAEQLRED